MLQSEKSFGFPDCPGISIVGTCPGTPAGSVPSPLSYENEQVVRFFGKINMWIFDGMGGYKMEAIREAFDIYEIPHSIRLELFERITALLQGYARAQVKNNKKS